MKPALFYSLILTCLTPVLTRAQADRVEAFDLESCIAYAVANQPALRATRFQDSIAALDNAIALSAWKPQVAITGSAQHYFKRPASVFPDFTNPESGLTRVVQIGAVNSSVVGGGVRQLLYSPAVLRDLRLRDLRREAARLQIEEAEIRVKSEVSRAFYRALQATEQTRLSVADTTRLARSLRDAKLFFEEGLRDKVDYKRATIALNTARKNVVNYGLAAEARTLDLKAQMGFPAADSLILVYQDNLLAQEVLNDAALTLEPRRRVEFRRIQVDASIQEQFTDFYRRAWQPTVSAGVQGNYNWFSQNIGQLYGQSFPNALGLVSVDLPLYQGGRRLRQKEQSQVLQQRLVFNLLAQRDDIVRGFGVSRRDFEQALNSYLLSVENLALAQEIYDVVDLQYREGISGYLEVVIAENDLQTARFAILNNLIAAAIARVEVRRTAGVL